MAKRAGSADLPLHSGHVPKWLADRMTRLGGVISEAVVHHYGRDELLRRLAHPFWFQSFGAVMGMDWHSSGITTSVIGALKRGLAPLSKELGIHVCGGRGRHSRQTPHELIAIGERVGFDASARRDLMRAGRLHDIGKLGISNRILDKPGRLTDGEFAKVRQHPRLTHDILSRVTPFRGIAEIAANHHEKLDGSGYHRGLTAEHLDAPSRVLTVADVYDALTQDRPYREAMMKERALGILAAESGERLCPMSVAVLYELAAEEAV